MADLNQNGLFVVNTRNEQNGLPEQGGQELQKQAQMDDWQELNHQESSYHREYDAHMELANRLENEKRAKGKADGTEMFRVKQSMQSITTALQENMAEDEQTFRFQLQDTVVLYDNLIRNCNEYLQSHRSWKSEGRRRIRIVQEVLEHALSGRRHFTDLAGAKNLYEQRIPGMLLGNMLGNIITAASPKSIEMDVASAQKTGELVRGKEEGEGKKGSIVLSVKENRLEAPVAHAKAASDLFGLLGVQQLIRKTELVCTDRNKKKNHYGIHLADKFNESDNNLEHFRSRAKEAGKELRVVYSAEAMKQMTSIQVMNFLLGRDTFTPEKDLLLVNDFGEEEGEMVLHVSQVYMDNAVEGKLFHDKMGGEALKKKNGNLPAFNSFLLPAIDTDFVSAIMMMDPGMLGVMSGNLLSKRELAAFSSRLSQVRQVLGRKLREENGGIAAEFGIVDANHSVRFGSRDWYKKENLEQLQTEIDTKNPQLMPGMFTDHARIEGVAKDASALEKRRDEIYLNARTEIEEAASDYQRFKIILWMLQGARLGEDRPDKDQQMVKVYWEIGNRLFSEYMTEGLLMAGFSDMMDNTKKILDTHNSWKIIYDEVPQEMRDEEAIQKFADDEEKRLRESIGRHREKVDDAVLKKRAKDRAEKVVLDQYVWLKMKEEHSHLFADFDMGDDFLSLQTVINRRLRDTGRQVGELIQSLKEQYKARYDKENGESKFDQMMARRNRIREKSQGFSLLKKASSMPSAS